ncbi:Peptidase S26A, signal peptidase I,Peptidase S24/S26A/S26B/S26C,Peptidase S26A, signal peptidase I [Cinara cedri]|uniref:Mitochondrial inner membrane protease subunit n=1 Tax=Cinara cedri TaxID=506608 RepID=A0A5E4NJ02_9HEMI|nr:Peptidase S26A, signal peptidase I,Peptidase S24/S26A/S26B/S26C,Peptidase S26A, signal peptidase I [Cinara cedri]
MALWRRVKNIFFGIAIGHTVTNTFGTVARVDGISMQPTLNPTLSTSSDMVFLSYLPVRFDSIKRGDLIVAISPRNPNEIIVKRVIGLEGDVVKLKRKQDDSMRKVVPKGYYWIEGDHKGHSYDSTSFGPISKGLVIAKVPAIVWPPSRWQLIQSEVHK